MEDKRKKFIEKAKEIHGENRYDYTNVIFKNVDTKVEIKCNTCGSIFFNTPYRHINQKRGCVTCVDNSKRKTTEHFIKESETIHGKGRYSYDKTNYINNVTEVTLYCNICKEYFQQTPQSHIISKCGCSKCALDNRIKDSDTFIKQVTEKYPDYNFDKTIYTTARNKVEYFCKVCNENKVQIAGSLLRNGCPDCSRKRGIQKQRDTKEQFIQKAVNKHGEGVYDYSEVEYFNNETKVKIKCNKCGKTLLQTPSTHLSGAGCYDCKVLKPRPIEQFISDSELIHGKGKYDYSLVHETYKNNRSLIKIKCNKCGNISTKTVDSHISGHSCKYCYTSKGEEIIAKYLTENNISFEREHKIDGCIHKRLLKFDFFLKDFNACIEFDGKQHFEVTEFFGGEQGLLETQIRDAVKNKFCLNNNIPLLRIKYDEQNIELLIKEFISNIS